MALFRHMKRPIHDAVWASLADEGFLADWQIDKGTDEESVVLREMADKVKELEDAGAPKPPRPSQLAADEPDRRLVTVSDLCAADARKRSDVKRYRADVLRDRVIALDGIPGWIRERVAGSIEPTESLTLELPAGHRLVERRAGDTVTWRVEPPLLLDEIMVTERRDDAWFVRHGTAVNLRWSVPVLRWSDFSQDWMSTTPVEASSDLDRLRVLAERLADDYGWPKDAAVAFLLSDVVPLIRHLTVTSSLKGFGARGRGRMRRRILVEADAWVKPKQVAAAFGEARRALGIKGAWPLRGWNARVIEFLAGLNSTLTWKETMERWNSDGAKGWGDLRADPRRFSRDVGRAYEQLGSVFQIGSRASREDQHPLDAADG